MSERRFIELSPAQLHYVPAIIEIDQIAHEVLPTATFAWDVFEGAPRLTLTLPGAIVHVLLDDNFWRYPDSISFFVNVTSEFEYAPGDRSFVCNVGVDSLVQVVFLLGRASEFAEKEFKTHAKPA